MMTSAPLARFPLIVLLGLFTLTLGCASTHGMVSPAPFPRTVPSRAPLGVTTPGTPAFVEGVIQTALQLRGTPYRYGGEDPLFGLDCSGLVFYVFLRHHIVLPRTAAEQYAVGLDIRGRVVEPGDLIFFSTVAPGPSHVGIAIDSQRFVHAPGTGGVVRVDRFDTPYWQQRVAGIRRVLGLTWGRGTPVNQESMAPRH
jgi:cell wall-associated NlpC family hydrolase